MLTTSGQGRHPRTGGQAVQFSVSLNCCQAAARTKRARTLKRADHTVRTRDDKRDACVRPCGRSVAHVHRAAAAAVALTGAASATSGEGTLRSLASFEAFGHPWARLGTFGSTGPPDQSTRCTPGMGSVASRSGTHRDQHGA